MTGWHTNITKAAGPTNAQIRPVSVDNQQLLNQYKNENKYYHALQM